MRETREEKVSKVSTWEKGNGAHANELDGTSKNLNAFD
jgi:hypothetical protein